MTFESQARALQKKGDEGDAALERDPLTANPSPLTLRFASVLSTRR